MKTWMILLVAVAFGLQSAFAARLYPSKGRVVDEQGQAIEYATVVLLDNGEQVAGMATDPEGRFSLKVPTGDYTLQIQYLGYEPLTQSVRVEAENDLGDFTLHAATTQIEGVVVKAQLIRREADRFVMDVANAPAAIGKDGAELLERAPGVWMDNERISINGKSGTKVFVNDRELRLEPEQLTIYLRSLRAEEIQKIEVIPTTGADHDADATGGIIRITLRKQRENGMQGSLSMRTTQSSRQHAYYPGGNISLHSGKWDLNASAWGNLGSSIFHAEEQTAYTTQQKELRAHSRRDDMGRNGGTTVGAFYEINDRHSLGAEFSYLHLGSEGKTGTTTDLMTRNDTNTASRYANNNIINGYEATFNYVWKIDTLGSTFKVLGDYAHRNTEDANDNRSRMTETGLPAAVDSLYRDRTRSNYDVAALTIALEKKFSPRWSLKAGAKYTRNEMRNDALYEYLHGESWMRNEAQSFEINYTEHIAAAYGVVTADLGRWSLVAGVRGEYTHTYGRNGTVAQDYFSLFPNANLSYELTEDGAWSLVAQYARTIERPRFWCLTPQRMQVSDYTYQIGNPLLNPAYEQDISLTLVMAHKYTLTAGVQLDRDEINQTTRADADDPDMLGVLWVNFDRTKCWYLAANLPFQPAKWMQLNLGANFMRRGQRLDQHAPETFRNIVFLNASTTFSLPGKWYIDLSYRYQGRLEVGNILLEPMQFLNAGVKKRFGERFTLSVTGYALLNEAQRFATTGDGFVREVRTRQPWTTASVQVGFTYNFKAGKAFRKKAVEAAASEEKGRM